MKTQHWRIHGDVQGVGLRRNMQILAEGLGITGWVKNCSNGTVEAVVQGLDQNLENFLRECYNLDIAISNIEIEQEANTKIYTDFSIVKS